MYVLLYIFVLIKLIQMTYKIEKVAPKPAVRNGYPLDLLKVGESFLEANWEKSNSLKVAASYFNTQSKGKKKLSVRKEEGGYRCYRIK